MSNKFISPLTWPGGKAKNWKLIKSYFPKDIKNTNYIEPFSGGGSIGLNALKENMFKSYNFNDINKRLMRFREEMLSDNDLKYYLSNDWFYPKVNDIEEAKKLYQYFKEEDFHLIGYLMSNNLTFNGNYKGTFSQQRLEQNRNDNKAKRIIECSNLLYLNKKKIILNNVDYQNLILDIKKDNFYFIDPPYFNIKNLYKHDDIEWDVFLYTLQTINYYDSKFLLTINDLPETRKMFKQFNIHEVEWKYTSSNTKKSPVKIGKELIITNYEVNKNDF